MINLKQSLNMDGFVLLPEFLSSTTVCLIIEDFHFLVQEQLKQENMYASSDLYSDLKALFEKNEDRYLKTIKAFSRVSSIHRCFNNDKVYSLVNDLGIKCPLIPTSPVVHLMSDNLKIKNGYFGQGAHQDWTSMQGSLNSLVLWIALTDVDEINFPVEVISGTHLLGLANGKPLNDYFEVDKNCYNEKDFVSVKLSKGSAVVFSSFLIHRTGVTNRHGFRIGMSYRFDDANERTFIERTYPTVYRRTVERALQIEGFPSLNQVREQYSDIKNSK